MKKTIANVWRLSLSDFKFELPALLVFWLVGEMLGILLASGDEADVFPMGAMLIMLLGAVMLAAIAIIRFGRELQMYLAFGASRRVLCVAESCNVLLHGLVHLAACAIGVGLHLLIVQIFWAHSAADFFAQWAGFPLWQICGLTLLGQLAVGLLGGGVMLRFGRKGFWTLYFGGMLLCFTTKFWLNGLEQLMENNNGALGSLPGLMGLAAAMMVLLGAVGAALLQRASAA